MPQRMLATTRWQTTSIWRGPEKMNAIATEVAFVIIEILGLNKVREISQCSREGSVYT